MDTGIECSTFKPLVRSCALYCADHYRICMEAVASPKVAYLVSLELSIANAQFRKI